MDSSASSLMNIYKFPTGRRLNAVREVARRALALLANDIAAHASIAANHDNEVLAMEARTEDTSRNRYGPDAPVLDRRVDSTAVGVEAHLEAQERVYGSSSQRGRDAAFVRRKLFPQGAGAITRLPYVPEYERISTLLQRAREPEIAAVIARIPELSALLGELETVNAEYGNALGAYDRDRPGSAELLAAQARGQELLCELAALIIARYALLPDQRAEREALLEPILRQNEEIRLARQRRRKPRDIDPDTGIELPDADQPGVEPVPAGNDDTGPTATL